MEGSQTKATYSYIADGTKAGVVDDNNEGFVYLGSLVYNNNSGNLELESTSFGGGRINKTSGSYDINYFITDHLGSTRAIVDNSGTIKEQNDYYPFGMRYQSNSGSAISTNRYTFSGKEIQTTGNVNYLDFGARQYDDFTGRWFVIDPLAEKIPWQSPYVYCSNNPINRIDPDGMLDGDIYNLNGVYIGNDGKDDNKVYLLHTTDDREFTEVQSIIHTTVATILDNPYITDLTEETGVTHSEFQQLAAFAYNETYDNNTIDKYRVANTVVNRQEEAGGTLQKTIDGLRYNNDSHEARMDNVQKLSGTATNAYAKFMNTSLGERNNNTAMKNSNAAALNAVSPKGVDYTTSLDGKSTATQWRGAKAGSTSNRFFTGYPVSTSNQITKFKYNELK